MARLRARRPRLVPGQLSRSRQHPVARQPFHRLRRRHDDRGLAESGAVHGNANRESASGCAGNRRNGFAWQLAGAGHGLQAHRHIPGRPALPRRAACKIRRFEIGPRRTAPHRADEPQAHEGRTHRPRAAQCRNRSGVRAPCPEERGRGRRTEDQGQDCSDVQESRTGKVGPARFRL